MKVEPVSRVSLSDAVFQALRTRILAGELLPDSTLPAERELCAAFQVNRGALREALKRLEQLGLVQIRQGGATRVVDFRSESGLELLPSLLESDDAPLKKRAIRGLFELRSTLGPEVARRAAERRKAADADAIDDLVARMADPAQQAPVALQHLSMALWERMAVASDNLVYRCMYNSMRSAWEPFQEVGAHALVDELSNHARYQKLGRAIREQQPDRAAKLARELLDLGFAGVTRFVGGLK